jgi:glycerophosphoryl diester phosphodiesterase
LEHNCDFIEIDVQQTADSVVVVNHDKTIKRTTNGTGFIKNLTFNQLQQFPIESKTGQTALNEKIPALEQVIKFINGRSGLIIEIKSGSNYYPAIENRVLDIIQRNNARNWCVIQSFNTDILRKVHYLDPEIELHKVCFGKIPFIPVWISDRIEFRKIENMDFIKGIAVYYPFINKEIIRVVHETHKKINAWTVDSEAIFKKLTVQGIDGIITNYPDLSFVYK